VDEVCSGGVPLSPPAKAAKARGWAPLAKRVLSTAVLLPAFVWIVAWAPAAVFVGMVTLLGALGQWEFLRMFQRAGIPVLTTVGVVGGAAITASFALPPLVPLAFSLVALGILAAGLARAGGAPRAWEPVVITLAGVCYVNWLLGHAVELHGLAGGLHWIWLLVLVTWVGETSAYFVGSMLGRRKLAPAISPKKTVEGALAQLVISPLAALAAQPWLGSTLTAAEAVGLGLVLGVVGQVGDLVESALKRSVGAKDAGQLIPGHGGILDRLDGLLFNTPVLFYYVAYTRGTGT
jgi:phosphatidate cytidylyltransferase